ncbi:hypothetical protein [Rhizorhapis suberifaciens]|uniref:hypothetical protein n=1 Tax=Rhizorhapis suberifaciens TaxID=13656 RepID=UPI0016144BB0|nr:hypothetical protein [Rhizorhapis suberifaciens]
MRPCPWCGSSFEVRLNRGWWLIWSTGDHEQRCPIRNRNPFDETAYSSKQAAIAAWNTRHRLTAQAQGGDVEKREAVTEAVYRAIYGDVWERFQDPEETDFAEKVADAVLTALSTHPTPTELPGDALREAEKETNALRMAWWNDMKARGCSDDVAIRKIKQALATKENADNG